MPDALMQRVKTVAARRKTTFRALVLDALERSLEETKDPFKLQDASVGSPLNSEMAVPNDTINDAINEQRSPQFKP